jgi:hypothetical protein
VHVPGPGGLRCARAQSSRLRSQPFSRSCLVLPSTTFHRRSMPHRGS